MYDNNTNNSTTLTTERFDTRLLLYGGFAAVITIVLAVALIGLQQVAAVGSGMERVVSENNRRIELVTRMRDAARERSVLLQSMMVIDDPFERDALTLRMSEAAAEYLVAREQLLLMPLRERELHTLQQQHLISANTAAVQNQIAGLLNDQEGSEALARELFFQQALPGQNRAMGMMEEFITRTQGASKVTLAEGNEALMAAHRFMPVLVLLGIVISVVIARAVVRRNRRVFEQLHHIGDNLERQVLARTRAEEQLRESEARERTIRENILDGVITLSPNGVISSVNHAVARMFGYPAEQLVFQHIETLLPDYLRGSDGPLKQLARQAGRDDLLHEMEGLRQDGTTFPMEVGFSEVWLERRRMLVMVVSDITLHKQAEQQLLTAQHDLEMRVAERTAELEQTNQQLAHEVAERRRAEERMTHLANHDPLTGLPNRSLFKAQLETALPQARRHDRKVALLFMDLDGFKQVNDSLGHDAGDQLLKAVSARMRTTIRAGDVLARMGGDEFTLLVHDLESVEGATCLANKIVEAVARPFRLTGHHCQLGVSIGISIYPDQSRQADELLRLADDAMYEVKRNGRSGFFLPSDEEQSTPLHTH